MDKALWLLDEQTAGKHVLLGHYLDGWFPILSRWNGRLLFIDGFAGPGEYEHGHKGSPLVALDCVRSHQRESRLQGVEIVFLFVESNPKRARHLKQLLDAQESPENTTFEVLEGEFQDHMTDILDLVDQQNTKLAPAFVMIDPFGVKGSPMELIGRVLNNERSECLISFMYEPIRRFHGQPEFGPHLDQLFGTPSWRDCLDMPEGSSKKLFLHDLFRKQLKRHGAKYVISFELWNQGRHVYTLYFATNSLKGCDLMKASIWKVDVSGGYAFHSAVAGTPSLFETDTEALARQLRDEFGTDWTQVEELESFVMSDKTHFHLGHLRRKTLGPLERQGGIEVSRPLGGRGFPLRKGIKVRFN